MSEPTVQVLLVEDNQADAVLLRDTLREAAPERFGLTHVLRLEEAVERLDQKLYDVVLLDLGLPDSQGLATLERVRTRAGGIAVVVLTGLNDEALAVQALHAGAQDYLVKGESAAGMVARAIRYAMERKRAEEIARQREAELAHLSRVSTVGHLASGLAHELNQPLSAIVNYASVCEVQLDSGKPDAAILRTAVGEVMNEARRAGAIISRLRSFVRKQEPLKVLLDLNPLVEESLNLVEFELRHQGIRPRVELAPDLPKVLADVVQIEQVLVNLIYNAMEAMGSAASPHNGLSVTTAVAAGGGEIEVCVIDNGPGMTPGDLVRLFEPFFTTKPQGLGMGLNISRSIVERHGGRLAASANPAGGMCFCFTLPVATAEAMA